MLSSILKFATDTLDKVKLSAKSVYNKLFQTKSSEYYLLTQRELDKLPILTEDDYLEFVRKEPELIGFIPNPSERVQIEAVKYGKGGAIRYIANPTDFVKYLAVYLNPKSIRAINNPSDVLIALARAGGYTPVGESKQYIKKHNDSLFLSAGIKAHINFIKEESVNDLIVKNLLNNILGKKEDK